MTDLSELVYGEPIGALVTALRPFVRNARIDDDGMWVSSCQLEPQIAIPLERALMRAEADLLIQDADHLGEPEADKRAPPQRRADALVEIARRIGDAASR